jgi:hypothetical protein
LLIAPIAEFVMTPIKPSEDTSTYFEWLDKLEQQPEKPVSPRVKELQQEANQEKKDIDTDAKANAIMRSSNYSYEK